MLVLAIDTALEACSAAIFDSAEETIVASESQLMARGHAEALIPILAAVMQQAAISYAALDRIAVAVGPGSFTGLRVGLAAARALALAWNCPVLGYPTLALVAAQALEDSGADQVLICMTGGHGEWFVQGFDAALVTTLPLASLKPADAASATPTPLVAGSQAEALVAARGSGEAMTLHPDARRFALLDPALLTTDIALIYGRAPDARLPGQGA